MTVPHEDIDRRVQAVEDALKGGIARFNEIERHQSEQAASMNALTTAVQELTLTIKPIRDEISTISQVAVGWKTVGTVGKFIKWLGIIAAAITSIIALVVVTAKAWAAAAMRGGL